ncbi:hypothetical protein HHK36_012257 [Tetracentron sinense]|uniref:Pectinesterase inhibitor domain-containing protein n=1 Tax=Tetracentron sinense TaxID=13715 RepID=A0A835DFD3_TETSI|nr:hypothetical protein HHK36_012257 [Tetracentron sinense]
MEPENHLLFIISISSLLFLYSAEATCVPRNLTYHIRYTPPKSPQLRQPDSSWPPKTPPPPHSQPLVSPPLLSQTLSVSAASNPTIPPLLHFSVVDPAIKKICDATDNPALCISAVVPHLTGKVDPLAVLEMMIKACINKAQFAMALATRIAKSPTTPSAIASYLDACKDSYSDAMDNLQSATDAISTRDTGTMNSMLSAALTDFGTCEDGFAETPGVNSPMAEWDDMLSKLASNCLAIVSLL